MRFKNVIFFLLLVDIQIVNLILNKKIQCEVIKKRKEGWFYYTGLITMLKYLLTMGRNPPAGGRRQKTEDGRRKKREGEGVMGRGGDKNAMP
jgi:hypothetical protein